MTKELLVKHNDKPSENIGKDPYERSINELLDKGIINIDKDAGPTSHQTVDSLKKVMNIPKAGHSGTLDPQVTGVLLTGLGRATRLMEYMLKSNKEYVCLMYVHKEVSKEEILEAFDKFTGTITQIPPIISAVKRQARERTIYSIDLLDYKDNGKNILFRVACQHGTYIRKLCTDIGEHLGVGAQMIELRRTKAGPLTENDNIVSLDNIRSLYELYNESKEEQYEKELRKVIQPMEVVLKDFKKVYVRDSAVDSIARGSSLAIPGICKLEEDIEMGEEVALMTLKGELIAMGTAYLSSKQVMKKNKGAFVKTNKVFMEMGYYPRVWKFEDSTNSEE